MNEERIVLVAGAHGVSGVAAAEQWRKIPGTAVYGLSRRDAALPEGVIPVQVDLLNREGVTQKLGQIRGISQVVFGAYIEKASVVERSEVNVAILRNLLDVVESTSPCLERVVFYQGGKAYGADLGPFKTPAREDDPRLMGPNFYYDQEDFLRQRQVGKEWTWTALRPEAVCGFALANPMNLAMVIAIYAAISKELGLPLRFPGTIEAYQALYQLTSAEILGKASVWAGISPQCRNEIFNITNGDYFRWQYMWPKIAKMFQMETAEPVPIPLATYMADKADLWNHLVDKYGLVPHSYSEVVAWPFGDMIFNHGFDNITSTIKARRAGFDACIDTEEMFQQFFQELRQRNVIPKLIHSRASAG